MFLPFVEFRPVVGYEDYYEISADGALFSKITNSFRTQIVNNQTGYATVVLVEPKTGKHNTVCIHRLVAETWVPNPHGYRCVNHKNENKLDNHASNLEWCTYSYNNTYHDKHLKCAKYVEMVDLNTGRVLEVYRSAHEAERQTGITFKNISAVCREKRKSAGGYGWRFQKED